MQPSGVRASQVLAFFFQNLRFCVSKPQIDDGRFEVLKHKSKVSSQVLKAYFWYYGVDKEFRCNKIKIKAQVSYLKVWIFRQQMCKISLFLVWKVCLAIHFFSLCFEEIHLNCAPPLHISQCSKQISTSKYTLLLTFCESCALLITNNGRWGLTLLHIEAAQGLRAAKKTCQKNAFDKIVPSS